MCALSPAEVTLVNLSWKTAVSRTSATSGLALSLKMPVSRTKCGMTETNSMISCRDATFWRYFVASRQFVALRQFVASRQFVALRQYIKLIDVRPFASRGDASQLVPENPFFQDKCHFRPCFVLGNAYFKEKVWHECMFVPEKADFKDKVRLDCMFVLEKAGFKEKVCSQWCSSLEKAILRTNICVHCVILYLVVYLQGNTTLDHSLNEDGKTIWAVL